VLTYVYFRMGIGAATILVGKTCCFAAGAECAGHVQQLGSESLLPNLMEVKG